MATNASITTNYVGTVAGDYIRAALKDAVTIEKGLVYVKPNITNGKGFIRKGDNTLGLQDYSCQPTPSGSLTINEKVLEPKKLMIVQSYCKEDFKDLWDSYTTGFSAWNNGELPTDEKNLILNLILDKLALTIDQYIWTGSGATSGQFAGLLPKLEADADVIDINAVSAITPTNVVAEIQKTFLAIPSSIRTKQDLIMVVSDDVYWNYVAALANQGFGMQYQNQDNDVLYFNKVKIQVVPTLPERTMIAYQPSNFWLGTALQADFNEVKVIDQSETSVNDMIDYKVVFAADTNFGYGGEVVLYNPA